MINYQNNIFFQINRSSRYLIRKMSEIVRKEELEASGFLLLCSLAENPCYGLTELATKFGMDRTTLSRGLYLLIKKGYAKKQPSLDKRFSTFSITAMGRKIVDKYLPMIDSLHEAMINSNESLANIYKFLKGQKTWKD